MVTREILFRGKRIDNGEWVEGYYVKAEKLDHSGDEHFIIEYAADGKTYEVIPETVGQYTGRIDKNGKKVFEDDVVRIFYGQLDDDICKVVYSRGTLVGVLSDGVLDSLPRRKEKLEVIGNIHDNPELLEVSK